VTDPSNPPEPILTPRERIDVLLAEYHALYRLAEFRMGALDKRVPAAGAAIVAFLSGVPVLPDPAGMVLLVVIPASLIWFVRTTINHARSFEDLIRRIEEIETAVNAIAGEALISFQSTHPSRGKSVGGRTSSETLLSANLASLVLGFVCGITAIYAQVLEGRPLYSYLIYLASILIYVLVLSINLRRYRFVASDKPICCTNELRNR